MPRHACSESRFEPATTSDDWSMKSAYIAGLREPDWAKTIATVIDDYHEMIVRMAKR
jgi:hypothetical protein